jgi:predicted amidohydrolase YtcJ
MDRITTEAADQIFMGGRISCSDPVRRFATALAVAGGRIVAIGHDEIRDLAGADTQIHQLAGGLVVPGFVDAHVHPIQGGLERRQCDLSDLATREEYLDAVRAYQQARTDVTWVTGGGWQMSAFPGGTPTREDLDRVCPDRPVFLPNRDHHGAWVNSLALELAGVDATTPDPGDGRIERASDGSPSGTLHEGAMQLVDHLLPATTPEELRAALLDAQAYLHSLGITGWQDAIVGEYANIPDTADVYLAAAEDGALTARVVGAMWWHRDRGVEQIDSLVERRRRYQGPNFTASSVKIMQDGVAENFTASMLEPYLDCGGSSTDNTGLSFVDPPALCEYVSELDAAGFQVHVHTIGDRAVREALDAVEVARVRNGPNDLRHHLAHIQVVHPDDIKRFRRLGVSGNMQPLWAALEPQMVELTLPFLGEPRSGWQYPFGALLRSGASLGAGSDWPVSSPNPLWGIHVAVNRTLPPQEDEQGYDAFLPEQSLDLSSALTAYTAGSAYINHRDDAGTLAVGQLADLAVLDRDIFAAPAEEIALANVVATFVGGVQVYAE